MKAETTFILGGARSGKSKFAEDMVLKSGKTPIYLATGRALDEDMVARIDAHKERRQSSWRTVEEPLALVDALSEASHESRMILVDCITLWITNLMIAEANVAKEAAGLVAYLKSTVTPIVIVSNETGSGVMPDNRMAREFSDLSGTVHQEIAAVCNHVYLVTAGLPLKLK